MFSNKACASFSFNIHLEIMKSCPTVARILSPSFAVHSLSLAAVYSSKLNPNPIHNENIAYLCGWSHT
jgi:hypothetical protein